MNEHKKRAVQLECLLEQVMQQGKSEDVWLIRNMIRCEKALGKLDWETVKKVRKANGYKLFPLDWDEICDYFDYELPFDFCYQEEFEARLKELFESLYGWKLYEPCPKCGNGILIPVWSSRWQYTPFCGCSEYSNCDYSKDREGKPIVYK